MFRKIIDYITSLIHRVVRQLFGTSHKGYTFGRRCEPELPRRIGYEEFRDDWYSYCEMYHDNFELA